MDTGRCPSCGAVIQRVHRDAVDRWVSLFRSVHRYRCTSPKCGWHGVLGNDPPSRTVPVAHPWRARAVWLLLGVGLAYAAHEANRRIEWSSLAPRQETSATPPPLRSAPRGSQAQSLATPAGDNFDGEELPEVDERVAQNPSPLTLRRNCSWGVPGVNRYQGTVEQALHAAQLPAEVVRDIAHKAAQGWTNGKVEITRNGIRTIDGERYFGKSALAMGFGNTLCFDTRVNFKPGHVEYADLFEAVDRRGQSYSVMVPYVCQNVAVLGERAEENGDRTNGNGVPEPHTWMLVALALAAAAAARRRRARGSFP